MTQNTLEKVQVEDRPVFPFTAIIGQNEMKLFKHASEVSKNNDPYELRVFIVSY